MAYIHKGTKCEHSDTPARIEDRCTFNYCSICNDWFYRMDKDGLERLLGEPEPLPVTQHSHPAV